MKFEKHFEDEYVENHLADYILENNLIDKNTKIICVGTDRSTGDCLGPLVGTFLKEKGFKDNICGTLESPIHAQNIKEIDFPINTFGIDASLSDIEFVGEIRCDDKPVKPGAAFNKNLPPIGDRGSIRCNVNISGNGFLDFEIVKNTRLYFVYKQAEVIANALEIVFNKLNIKKAC